jgi:hypothetical protein
MKHSPKSEYCMCRECEVQRYYDSAMVRVATTPPPVGQLYAPGTRVWISRNLGSSMSHFPAGQWAIVGYTYAHAYGGTDVKSYALKLGEGDGSCAWYYEHQLLTEPD